MKNTQTDFDRIFEAWKTIDNENVTALKYAQFYREISIMESNSENAMAAMEISINSKHFYDIYITERYIKETPLICEFFKVIKDVSEEAYEFISGGHDYINFVKYLKFSGMTERSEKINRIIELKNHTRYLAYAFRRILKQKDESKKKSMLRGLLGM